VNNFELETFESKELNDRHLFYFGSDDKSAHSESRSRIFGLVDGRGQARDTSIVRYSQIYLVGLAILLSLDHMPRVWIGYELMDANISQPIDHMQIFVVFLPPVPVNILHHITEMRWWDN
jgi:hypothetical protein